MHEHAGGCKERKNYTDCWCQTESLQGKKKFKVFRHVERALGDLSKLDRKEERMAEKKESSKLNGAS
jgi:hypothetical protein